MIDEKVIQAYADGSTLETIAESFKISMRLVKGILLKYKEDNRLKRTFTNDFKKVIAERDINGVARSTIAEELDINVSTVKKACEKFGQAIKEKATSEQAYTLIEGVHDLKVCPTCQSKKVNEIDSISDNVNTTGIYCKDCGDEHFIITRTETQKVKGKKKPVEVVINDVYKVNFEYLEE
jgi:transposase-like protein